MKIDTSLVLQTQRSELLPRFVTAAYSQVVGAFLDERILLSLALPPTGRFAQRLERMMLKKSFGCILGVLALVSCSQWEKQRLGGPGGPSTSSLHGWWMTTCSLQADNLYERTVLEIDSRFISSTITRFETLTDCKTTSYQETGEETHFQYSPLGNPIVDSVSTQWRLSLVEVYGGQTTETQMSIGLKDRLTFKSNTFTRPR